MLGMDCNPEPCRKEPASSGQMYYTAFPGPVADRVGVWLKRRNIEYRIFSADEVPDTVPQGYEYHGRKSVFGVAFIYCHIPPEELKAAEKGMRGIPTAEL